MHALGGGEEERGGRRRRRREEEVTMTFHLSTGSIGA